MLLDMIGMSEDLKETQKQWATAVKVLKKSDSKWAKLSTAVPSTLVRLLRTQLELAIMSIPDQNVSLRTKLFSHPAIPNYPRLKIMISPPCHCATIPSIIIV